MSAGCNKHRYPIIAYELCEQLLKTLARHAPVKSFNCCCMSCLHREKAEHAEQMACSNGSEGNSTTMPTWCQDMKNDQHDMWWKVACVLNHSWAVFTLLCLLRLVSFIIVYHCSTMLHIGLP